MQDVMIISLVACEFFLWFNLPCDWSLQNQKSNQSASSFWIRIHVQKRGAAFLGESLGKVLYIEVHFQKCTSGKHIFDSV